VNVISWSECASLFTFPKRIGKICLSPFRRAEIARFAPVMVTDNIIMMFAARCAAAGS